MENDTIKSCFERRYSVYKVDVLPPKDTKLLTKLLKTRAAYDETRSQILSNSLTGLNKCKTKTKKNKNPADYQKVKTIVNLVTSVDKGADLANVKKTSKTPDCSPKAGATRVRNRATQIKQVKPTSDEDKKEVHRVCSDPCKMNLVQRNRCQTTCIQVQMVDTCPKQNMPICKLINQMCKPVKVSACCSPSKPVKCIKDDCNNKSRVKTKNAFTRTSSSKTRTAKSEADIKVKKCCSRPRRDWRQNSLIVNFLRKRGSHKCCKASKPDVTQVTNIFCCNKGKPCSTHVVEHRSEHKRCSHTKIHLKKRGTQPLNKPCCAVQWKPNKAKPARSCSRSSSKKRAKKSRKVSKRPSAKKCVKTRPYTPPRVECKCDKHVQTKSYKKRSKHDKSPKNTPVHDSNCSCCRTCKSNRFYHSMLKVKKGCTQQIVRSYSVICKTTRPCCANKSSPGSKSRKVNTVRSSAKMKKVQSVKEKIKEPKVCPALPLKKFQPVRRGLRISSNCCIDIEFYRERPRKVKVEKDKKNVEKTKKVNKGTKTRPTCCSLCYFVEIYRRKPEPVIIDSSSSGTFTSSVLFSGIDSSYSSSAEDVKYRTITFDEYSPPCEKVAALGKKLSDVQFQNDLCAQGTTLTKNMLKRGLFTKFYSATTLDECPLKLLINQCGENKHNVFFRRLGHKLYRDLTTLVYLPDALYATEQKVKHFWSKSDMLKYGVYCFGKCCNRALLILWNEMGSLRASFKSYCRILFWG